MQNDKCKIGQSAITVRLSCQVELYRYRLGYSAVQGRFSWCVKGQVDQASHLFQVRLADRLGWSAVPCMLGRQTRLVSCSRYAWQLGRLGLGWSAELRNILSLCFSRYDNVANTPGRSLCGLSSVQRKRSSFRKVVFTLHIYKKDIHKGFYNLNSQGLCVFCKAEYLVSPGWRNNGYYDLS